MSDIIGLQLYTVRDETAKDFTQTIRRVAEIGYGGVEFAGYGNLSAREMAALLAETDLRAIGTHVGFEALEANLDDEINYCLEIGCTFLVIPYLNPQYRSGDGFKRFVERVNEWGQHSKARGVTLGYHNHDFEFAADPEGLFIERLLAATNPDTLQLELDTFWVAFAGADPLAFIKKHAGRFGSLHLKDMTPDRKFTEVGDGILDIAGFIEAARQGGTHNFLVENDQPEVPSLESARRSFENLHRSLT
ncbi:MAG TPA: sugar phosphate isomerase/epimerase [Ktedonobacteraceae bacterium]|nr:sugar phosphate isomerase/epimerase [Ktedonobacteraceae bacterium]